MSGSDHVQADGTIVIPEVLRKWIGKERIGVAEE
jgi:seryl-tRNA synthetase